MALWTVLLFIGAGTVRWIRGWICSAVYFVSMTITGMVIHHLNHDLIQARSKLRRKDTQSFDKIFIAIFIPLTFMQVAIAGLDGVRFSWSHMTFWTLYPGIAVFLIGIAIVTDHGPQPIRGDHGSHSVRSRSHRHQFRPVSLCAPSDVRGLKPDVNSGKRPNGSAELHRRLNYVGQPTSSLLRNGSVPLPSDLRCTAIHEQLDPRHEAGVA
jgi:hypothetical protein